MKTKKIKIKMKKTTLTLLFFSIFIGCFSSQKKETNSIQGIEKITIDAPTQALFRERPNDNVVRIEITPAANSRKIISEIKFSFKEKIDPIFKKACLHKQSNEINDL
ncbi:MAG: hypothetical protein WAO94_05535, partial [Dysgonamonadaceae bacterium]